MLRSYTSNITDIEVLLRRIKHYDLILSVPENQTVNGFIEFLGLLESTTTILSASKSYLSEMESMLQITGMESSIVQQLKVLLTL